MGGSTTTAKAAGLTKADQILANTHRDLIVSKRKLRQADGMALVRLQREKGDQNLCFSSRPFVLCGLPVRPLPPGQLIYERRNGNLLLQIIGHPEFGVPYGQDRIVPIFLATLAVRQKSQTIRFRSASEMLATFGLQKGGKEYRRLIASFERIFGATMFFGTESQTAKARVVQRSRFNFLREAQIWYNRSPDEQSCLDDIENVIVLSDEFYAEIMAHPVPTDLEVVKVLTASPGLLDLFMWLSYRCFMAKGEESIPIFGRFGLVAQIGSAEYTRPRRMREKLNEWLEIIRLMWPQCPARISADGERLIVAHGTAVLARVQ